MFNQANELATRCKALSDLNRLRIVALCRGGEVSVGELVDILGQSQPRVSQHLKLLCDAGLLRRFRDGKRAFYRLPSPTGPALRQLIALLPDDEDLDRDAERLRTLRGLQLPPDEGDDPVNRALARALIDLTVAAPLGDLLDVGCGHGRVLKLLAGRANRAVGVDIDGDARDAARKAVFLAGLENCSLRQGDMYQLPFDDRSFDTIVLDDVLAAASDPKRALVEATRLLRPNGRLIVLSRTDADSADQSAQLAVQCRDAGLRMGPPRLLPATEPRWLLSVLTISNAERSAA